jgi:hypothetical protein
VRARENSSPEISRPVEARGRKGSRGETKALTRGATLPERERRERADARARSGRWDEPGRCRAEAADGGRGGGRWAVKPRGEERGGGTRERERERGGFGLAAGLFPSLLLFFFFSTLKLFKQTYLNSNKFEFKPYKLNTNKTMLQHECTSKLIL